MEFKRSCDGGGTWSEPWTLKYSQDMFEEHSGRSAMCEKALLTDENTIVLFYLLCDIRETALWEPYWTPEAARSVDGGLTWEIPVQVGNERGRVYDALYRSGEILALKFCNDATDQWYGTHPEHTYELWSSTDDGLTFTRKSVLPLNTTGKGYGTMEFLSDGALIVYIYNIHDEYNGEYVISRDNGASWMSPAKTRFIKKLRNPQLIRFGNGFLMHGRSGNEGEDAGHLVLYYSPDALHWDEGRYLCLCTAGLGAYSNSIVTGRFTEERALRLYLHASHAYKKNKTNVAAWWVGQIE